MAKPNLAVIILTKNEELHIARCLDNASRVSDEIYVVDSESTDRTRAIAEEKGATVVTHPWPGSQAVQFNWALDRLPVKAEWIMRLDADEYLTPELVAELKQELPLMSQEISGLVLNLRRYFLGRWIKRGTGAVKLLRVFRRGCGRSEERLMDEHIVLSQGKSCELQHSFVDDNLQDLSWWTSKHVGYAIREAALLLDNEYDLSGVGTQISAGKELAPEARSKRRMKNRYARLPLFWRSTAYFLYRYLLRGGFMEGKEGFLWHFLQGWWYRTLVDAKVMELKRLSHGDPAEMRRILAERYHIDLAQNSRS